MRRSSIRWTSYPRTESPPSFVTKIVEVFRKHEAKISTRELKKGLTSDVVLSILAVDLEGIGFLVERGKRKAQKITRPVFFGDEGSPTVRYEIDAYHPDWKCGLEVEAGRGWMGNAVYRDLIQASVMVDVDFFCIAVSNTYKYKSSGSTHSSKDYENTVKLADALFGHTRIQLPYNPIVLGY